MRLVSLMLYAGQQVNLARGKAAKLSSVRDNHMASNAVDGRNDTFAQSRLASGQWWSVDLGQKYWISQINLQGQNGMNRKSYVVITINHIDQIIFYRFVIENDEIFPWAGAHIPQSL